MSTAVATRTGSVHSPRKPAHLVPLIQAELEQAEKLAAPNYRRAGELLIEAKYSIEHGDWTVWLGTNFDLSERTAQRYMQLARGSAETISEMIAAAKAEHRQKQKDAAARAAEAKASHVTVLAAVGTSILDERVAVAKVLGTKKNHPLVDEMLEGGVIVERAPRESVPVEAPPVFMRDGCVTVENAQPTRIVSPLVMAWQHDVNVKTMRKLIAQAQERADRIDNQIRLNDWTMEALACAITEAETLRDTLGKAYAAGDRAIRGPVIPEG
jgi:hypothetical protein